MNISESHLSIQSNATSLKVTETVLPKLNISSAVNTIESPTIVTTTSTNSSINPTYNKPIQTDTRYVAPEVSISKETNQYNNSISDFEPESEQTPTIKKADTGKTSDASEESNHEIYSEAELDKISTLKSVDVEVSAHERAHASVGGEHTGTPSYSYETGPDGVKYAVSGEVSIDTSIIQGDPQATLQKAQQIKAAALAPMEPSGQDRKVAAKADQMATQARNDILEANNGVENNTQSSNFSNEASIQEHLTGRENLSIKSRDQSEIEQLMSERNIHINYVYQNSASSRPDPSLKLQA